ncbi:hypothetical protein DIPPA_03925 [Diplonema papillatum]|nr:hypothetical protein DIPPA_03925 [Diplonema papillatum]
MKAAGAGYLEAVRELIKGHAQVDLQNNDGWTALLKAVGFGRLAVVQELLGAKLAAAASAVVLQDNKRWSALIEACYVGNLGAVQELVGAGVRLDLADTRAQRWPSLGPRASKALRPPS